MSDTDSFIEEVTEEVRREQLFKYVRKYAWVAVVLVLGAVGATGYLEYQKAQTANAAQALGDAFAAAVDAEDPAARAEGLAALSPEAGEAQMIVDLRRAAELADAGDKAAALALLDGVANSGGSAVYTDMAKLKALILRGSEQDAAARDATLADLASPGSLYRPLALEQQGLAAIAADDKERAVALFTEVYQDSEATDGVRNRATQMLVALGAEVPAISQLLSE